MLPTIRLNIYAPKGHSDRIDSVEELDGVKNATLRSAPGGKIDVLACFWL